MEPRQEEKHEPKTPQLRKKPSKLLISVLTMLTAAVVLTASASWADVEKSKSSNGATVTKIRTNGRFADVILSDDGFNGFLTVSRDQISDTTALDFSFAVRNPDNPDIVFFWSGAGTIPNSAFTANANWSSAHLAVTTPTTYPVTFVVVNFVTGESTVAPWTPMTFDLTWKRNSFQTIFERVERLETFGPVTVRFAGAFSLETTSVSGTWDGHTMSGGNGDLLDTRGNTVEREIMIDPNP